MAWVMYRKRASICRDQRLWLLGLGDSPDSNFDYRTRHRYARM
jgi:hypothetical protein